MLGVAMLIAGCGAASGQSAVTGGGRGGHRATPAEAALAAVRFFFDHYVRPDGRVVRVDQGGDTVSEGQAYGMLMAAAVGDSQRFHTIWRWTRIHLQQPDGLFAYHWADGHVVDATPATDADLETARALLLAGRRFHDQYYIATARRVAEAILTHETARAGSLSVLIAGPWANKGSYLVIDPSYIDPVALRQLGQLTGNPSFGALASSGETLVNELTTPLPPDWATVNTQTGVATPVSGPSATSGPGAFTFDAPRALVWFGVSPRASDRAAVARAWSVFSATDPIDIVTEHSLSGAVIGSDHNPVTVIAAAAAAVAAGDRSAVPGLLSAASRLNAEHPTYYGSAWVALGRLLLSTNRLGPPAAA